MKIKLDKTAKAIGPSVIEQIANDLLETYSSSMPACVAGFLVGKDNGDYVEIKEVYVPHQDSNMSFTEISHDEIEKFKQYLQVNPTQVCLGYVTSSVFSPFESVSMAESLQELKDDKIINMPDRLLIFNQDGEHYFRQ